MKHKIETQTRMQIAQFLPNALRIAIASYRSFLIKGKSEESKDFKEHQIACKAALAHIELLLKLARLADLPDAYIENENERKTMLELIENGQKELKQINFDD